MASVETNDKKRAEMAELVKRATLGNGWKPAQLAALMRVTPGTVRAWFRGESMGTNAQRATLAALKTPAEERPRMREEAAQLRREAEVSSHRAAQAWKTGAQLVAESHSKRVVRLTARADFLETIGA